MTERTVSVDPNAVPEGKPRGRSMATSVAAASERLLNTSWKTKAKVIFFVSMLTTAVLVVTLLPFFDYVIAFLAWAKYHKFEAACSIICVHTISTVCWLPTGYLIVACGYLFGIWLGFLTAFIGSMTGAWCGFVAGRFLLREWVHAKVQSNRVLRAISLVVEERAFAMAVLVMMSPHLPLAVISYFFGSSNAPFAKYAPGAAIGGIPCILFYAYIGSMVKDVQQVISGNADPVATLVPAIGGLGLSLVLVVTVGKAAKTKLDQMTAEAEARKLQKDSEKADGANSPDLEKAVPEDPKESKDKEKEASQNVEMQEVKPPGYA